MGHQIMGASRGQQTGSEVRDGIFWYHDWQVFCLIPEAQALNKHSVRTEAIEPHLCRKGDCMEMCLSDILFVFFKSVVLYLKHFSFHSTVECMTFTVQNGVQYLTLKCYINGSFLVCCCMQVEWIKPSWFTW